MESSLTGAIRDAVASGEFRKALRLWEEYAGQLEEITGRGKLNEASLQEVAHLVEWTRTSALIARAHGFDDLAHRRAACRVAQSYSGNSDRRR